MSDAQLFAYGCAVTFTALAGAYTYFMGRFSEADFIERDTVRTDAEMIPVPVSQTPSEEPNISDLI